MNYFKESPKGEEGSDVDGSKCEVARPLVVFDDSKDDGDLRKSDKYVPDIFVKDSRYSVLVRASSASIEAPTPGNEAEESHEDCRKHDH